jgi:dTDP-4-dehydrorhamnose 3,5-epimerase-like enzyme
MSSLRSGARLVPVPSFRSEKPGTLYVSHVDEITGSLFTQAPRVYWNVNDTAAPTVRGGHVHPEGGKQEYLVCLHGEAIAELHSASGCERVAMKDPETALVLPCGVWHRFILSPGAVLLAVASEPFQAEESLTQLPCDCVL